MIGTIRTLSLPVGATSIVLTAEFLFFIATWHSLGSDNTVTTPTIKCYEATGTTGSPSFTLIGC